MNWKNLAFWIMISIVIGLSIYTVRWIKSESYQCVNNPYVYSIQKLQEANNAPVQCTCAAYKPEGAVSVLLTEKGFQPIFSENPSSSEIIIPNISFK